MDIFPKFKDSTWNHQYKEKGYIIVPFIDPLTCDNLIDFYNQYSDNKEAEFSTTMQASDLSKKALINQSLCDKVNEVLPNIIDGYRPLFANYLVKKPNSTYKVGIHQDWTYVDETQYRSFNIWVALCHTGAKNGGLKVLPKSHLLPLPIRYTPFNNNLKHFEWLIKSKSKLVEVKKGYAVIYDSALIHYSNANTSDQIRYAFGCVCLPNNAQPIHYYKAKEQLLEFETDRDFYNTFVPGEKPKSQLIKKIPFNRVSNAKLFFNLFKL